MCKIKILHFCTMCHGTESPGSLQAVLKLSLSKRAQRALRASCHTKVDLAWCRHMVPQKTKHLSPPREVQNSRDFSRMLWSPLDASSLASKEAGGNSISALQDCGTKHCDRHMASARLFQLGQELCSAEDAEGALGLSSIFTCLQRNPAPCPETLP